MSDTPSKIENMMPLDILRQCLTIGKTTYKVATKTKLVTAKTAEARKLPTTAAAAAMATVTIPNSTMILLDIEDATGLGYSGTFAIDVCKTWNQQEL